MKMGATTAGVVLAILVYYLMSLAWAFVKPSILPTQLEVHWVELVARLGILVISIALGIWYQGRRSRPTKPKE